MNSEGFIPMLAKLDDCIAYISSHVSNSELVLVKSLVSQLGIQACFIFLWIASKNAEVTLYMYSF